MRIKFSLRWMMVAVSLFAVLLGLDQAVQSVAHEFAATVVADPGDYLPGDPQPAWLGGPVVGPIQDVTNAWDRIRLRRRISVDYQKTVAGQQRSTTLVECHATFIVTPFGQKIVDHTENPTFTFY